MVTTSVADRLAALLDHLGLRRAHIGTQIPGDIGGFCATHADRLGSVVLCTPVRLDPAGFTGVADRVLMISGSTGLTEQVTRRAAERLAGSRRVELAQYEAPGWADVLVDRGPEVLAAMRDHLRHHGLPPAPAVPTSGNLDGLTWRATGSGPALVLLPFFLAPSQWDPVVADLSRDFTVIVLGGRHVGGVAALEDRARAPTYRALVRTMMELIDPAPGSTILDIGCGSGALDRMLVQGPARGSTIVATDLNPFLLREASVLAAEDGVAGSLRFEAANAEALPFPDASFDHAFTVTVLEECDADRALAELRRVVRPGGRVGVIVRAIDLPQWWHLDLPEELRRKAAVPPQSVGGHGVADASLYRRMVEAGFAELRCFPSLVTFDQPQGPIWRYREDHMLAQLDSAETTAWRSATAAAQAKGLLFMANPLHAAVGVRAG